VFKLCKYLLTITGDARYGDWIERLVWNGIGASIPMAADGRVFYYSDYNPGGGAKRQVDTAWTCCTGTRPQAVADYVDLVYFHNDSNLCVNLYVPATIRLDLGGVPVTVRQTTRFPEDDTSTLTVHAPRPAAFILRFRIPEWLAQPMEITVNGQTLATPVIAQHWTIVSREWTDGDQVQVRLPMGFHSSVLNSRKGNPAAVMYGPVVLAFRAPDLTFVTNLDLSRLPSELSPCPGEALTWRLTAAPDILARPFYAYAEGQPYDLYLDPHLARRISYQRVKFSGRWEDANSFRFSNQAGASAECAFTGAGVRWLGSRYDDAGRAEVLIDGKVAAVVDQYGPGRDLHFDWVRRGLAPGAHTLRLEVLPDKTEASKDHYINVAGFEPLDNEAE
jgi:hypothetical protein